MIQNVRIQYRRNLRQFATKSKTALSKAGDKVANQTVQLFVRYDSADNRVQPLVRDAVEIIVKIHRQDAALPPVLPVVRCKVLSQATYCKFCPLALPRCAVVIDQAWLHEWFHTVPVRALLDCAF